MKTKISLFLPLLLLINGLSGIVSAQKSSGEVINQVNSVQATPVDEAARNKDIITISGKILDAKSRQRIKYTKINFDKLGEEVLQASLDEQGNYLLSLNKKALGNPIRVTFKIAGYKRYVIRKLDRKASHLNADIYLEPMLSDEKSDAHVKYVMSDNPSNTTTTVIKMQ